MNWSLLHILSDILVLAAVAAHLRRVNKAWGLINERLRRLERYAFEPKPCPHDWFRPVGAVVPKLVCALCGVERFGS